MLQIKCYKKSGAIPLQGYIFKGEIGAKKNGIQWMPFCINM